MADITADDLRAAVAAGTITEAQAAGVVALADNRRGFRAAMSGDDEPFEFFRGFSEIFITVGLAILSAGAVGLLVLLGSAVAIGAAAAALSWFLSYYFATRRRMTLPTMLLSCVFAGAMLTLGAGLLTDLDGTFARGPALAVCGTAFIGMLAYFAVFRLPFAAFVIGLLAAAMVFILFGGVESSIAMLWVDPGSILFDLTTGSRAAYATLAIGVIAFVAAMLFDTRDPHRISRHSATAFWLHLIAAPALVNSIAATLYGQGGAMGYGLTALALLAITLLAMIIDRRSFLTAGIAYIAILVAWLFRGADGLGPVLTLLILGAFITLMGAFWTDLRAILMRRLPDFPGKNRLPPYREAP